MTTPSDPIRLMADDSEAPALRALLRAGQGDLPDADVVARIEARVLVAIAGGGGGGGGSGAARLRRRSGRNAIRTVN